MHTQKLHLPLPLVSRDRPPAPTPFSFWLMLSLLCALITFSNACASNTRRDVLSRTLIAVDAARTGFTTWDDAHQQDLVAKSTSYEQGVATLEEYRKRRAPVLLAFELAYQAIAVAALAEDEDGVALAKQRLQQLLELIQVLSASSE